MLRTGYEGEWTRGGGSIKRRQEEKEVNICCSEILKIAKFLNNKILYLNPERVKSERKRQRDRSEGV